MNDNDRGLAADLDKGIRALFEAAKDDLSHDSISWVSDYLEHYELGLAGETLLEGLEQGDLLLRRPELQPAADKLRLTLFPQ
jgi:hypothetical protein